ncbi:MAG: aminotransferase class III-fold pyridoxal phosphate-dependent enzyme, partial [Gemmatimonadetes bacterium]|nr:aminotransferase class III-fold pyridoxal phosphate-dependent enzyme [Gemmatimonadota bacterium]
ERFRPGAERARADGVRLRAYVSTVCGCPYEGAVATAAVVGLAERLVEIQSRREVIGEVRGGHGLYAVIELVRDRRSREPLAPWDQVHPALKELLRKGLDAGVSFAARGNLILIAPPLVIQEKELEDALTLLDRLIGELQAGITQRLTRPSPQPSPA